MFLRGSGVLELPYRPSILEFGFGGGTNFAVTVEHLAERGVEYHAVERQPVEASVLAIEYETARAVAEQALRHGAWERGSVSLRLYPLEFSSLRLDRQFDAIYFDPFGPHDEPESWSRSVFEVVARHLSPTGRLVTYSAAGWIRRNMALAGLFVATAPGPAGKREFTIAAKRLELLEPHRVRNVPG